MRKSLIIQFALAFPLLLVSCQGSSYKNEDEYKEVLSCAKTMRSRSSDSASFQVSGGCGYDENSQGTIFVKIPYTCGSSSDCGYFKNRSLMGTLSSYNSGAYRQSMSLTDAIIFASAVQGSYEITYTAEQVNSGL